MMKTGKSTLSVLFFLKREKSKKSGLTPIYVRITIDGKLTQFNTKLEINESHWGSGRAAGKSVESTRINSSLDEIRSCIHSQYHKLQQREGYVTAEKVRNSFLGKAEKEKSILSFFEQHNADFKRRVQSKLNTQQTYTRFELTRNRLADYLKDKYNVSDMAVSEITPQFARGFYLYLCETPPATITARRNSSNACIP